MPATESTIVSSRPPHRLLETDGSGVAPPSPASRSTPETAAASQISEVHSRRTGWRPAASIVTSTTPAPATGASAATTPRSATKMSAATISWPAMSMLASMRTEPMADEPAETPVAADRITSVTQTRQISSGG